MIFLLTKQYPKVLFTIWDNGTQRVGMP